MNEQEQIDFDARRVAAAFGVIVWDVCEQKSPSYKEYEGLLEGFKLRWCVCETGPFAFYISERWDKGGWMCVAQVTSAPRARPPYNGWQASLCENHPANVLMSRGLYRVGFEFDDPHEQIPPLTAHEKLELRLDLPREFWLPSWLDEVAA